MSWFFSPIKSTKNELGLFSDNAQFPIQRVVTVFFPRSAVPKIGYVVCFLGPLGEVGSLLK